MGNEETLEKLVDGLDAKTEVSNKDIFDEQVEQRTTVDSLPKEEVKTEVSEQVQTPTPTPQTYTDRFGRKFDPALHLTYNDGTPRLTPKGFCRIKRGCGQSQATSTITRPVVRTSFSDIVPSLDSRGIVEALFTTQDIYGTKYFGEAWRATPQEKEQVVSVWAKYITYKGWDKALSPELCVIATTCGFILPRILNKEIQAKISTMLHRNK